MDGCVPKIKVCGSTIDDDNDAAKIEEVVVRLPAQQAENDSVRGAATRFLFALGGDDLFLAFFLAGGVTVWGSNLFLLTLLVGDDSFFVGVVTLDEEIVFCAAVLRGLRRGVPARPSTTGRDAAANEKSFVVFIVVAMILSLRNSVVIGQGSCFPMLSGVGWGLATNSIRETYRPAATDDDEIFANNA